MKTEFPRQYLAAAAHFMADQDVRYYLKGVLVEALPTETRLVATDGAAVGALRHLVENADRFEVIIPAATVALVAKLPSEFLTLERDDAGQWRAGGAPFVPVEGKFPDYRRIIPTGGSGAAGDYDPALVARFAKAAKALKHKGVPIIRQNGKDSALVHFYACDHFVGVVSPYRHFSEKHPDLGAPSWGPLRA